MEDNILIDKIARAFNVELPLRANMEEYLDVILPAIRQQSEDLREEEFFLGKAWLEIRDQDDFHEAVLHFFNPEGEYLQSVDGNVHKGIWRYMPGTNKLMIDQLAGGAAIKSELFDLAFMDDYFFILKKHGNQTRKGMAKYFVLGYEPATRGLEWRDAVELLFNKYRDNSELYQYIIYIIVAIIAFFIIFSIL